MPIGKKFGTNAVKQIWAITYFTSVLNPNSHEKLCNTIKALRQEKLQQLTYVLNNAPNTQFG